MRATTLLLLSGVRVLSGAPGAPGILTDVPAGRTYGQYPD
jgi:hypothetical protein